MEQVKVLSAALALREFTVDELSALSGVKATSVRSVLNRNLELVHRISPSAASSSTSAEPGRRGRPSTKWAIADSAASRKLAAELDALGTADLSALPNDEQQPSTLAPGDRRKVAVSVAERALSQFLDEQDFDVKREILTSAQASLSYANEPTDSGSSPRWWRNDDSELAHRAQAVDALATLAATPQMQFSDGLLERTAGDVAAAMNATPTRGAALYFAPFSQLLAAHKTLPAVLWISDRDNPPTRVTNHWKVLHAGGVDLDDAHVLTQAWATPLLEVAAPLPMLLSAAGPKFVTSLLARTRTIPRPALVFGRTRESDLSLDAARWGASFVSMDWRSPKDFLRAINAVTASIDRHVAPDVLEVVMVEAESIDSGA
jgi:hypothetical protein